MLAISIGLCSALTMCITLVTTGLNASYGIETNTTLFVGLGIFIVAMFTLSSYVGLDKGLKN